MLGGGVSSLDSNVQELVQRVYGEASAKLALLFSSAIGTLSLLQLSIGEAILLQIYKRLLQEEEEDDKGRWRENLGSLSREFYSVIPLPRQEEINTVQKYEETKDTIQLMKDMLNVRMPPW